MDDGHRTAYNQTVLNTNSYSYDEVLILSFFFYIKKRTSKKGQKSTFS